MLAEHNGRIEQTPDEEGNSASANEAMDALLPPLVTDEWAKIDVVELFEHGELLVDGVPVVLIDHLSCLLDLAGSSEAVEGYWRSSGAGSGGWIQIKKHSFDILARRLPNVEYAVLDGNVAQVRWRSCAKGTGEKIVSFLRQQSGLTSVILDVRGNPGGRLAEGVGLISAWLPRGSRLLCLYRSAADLLDEENGVEIKSASDQHFTFPVHVIADSRTASTAEVVVALVKGNRLGKVLGRKTAGDSYAHVTFRKGNGKSDTVRMLIKVDGISSYTNRGISPDLAISFCPTWDTDAGWSADSPCSPPLLMNDGRAAQVALRLMREGQHED